MQQITHPSRLTTGLLRLLGPALVMALALTMAPAPQARAAAPSAATATAATAVTTAVTAAARKRPARAYRNRIMRAARRQAGTPYRYGATGPRAFDCSGYTSWVLRRAGRNIPRTSRAQAAASKRIRRSNRRRGDLVFFHSGGRVYHVGIYAGRGRIWHSPSTGSRVHRTRIWTGSHFYGRFHRRR